MFLCIKYNKFFVTITPEKKNETITLIFQKEKREMLKGKVKFCLQRRREETITLAAYFPSQRGHFSPLKEKVIFIKISTHFRWVQWHKPVIQALGG